MTNTRPLQPVLDWLRTTDIAEVTYRDGTDAVTLSLDDAGAAQTLPKCSFVPVLSPEVGIFRFSALGKPKSAEKDSDVAEGQVLGIVDTGKAKREVKAPTRGRRISVLIEEGHAVEYGQPLYFIRPM
jgi:acetyl-CoA carboxylase biotin carboxyl carrier protein